MRGFEILILEINSPSLTIKTDENTVMTIRWKDCASNLSKKTRTALFAKYEEMLDAMRRQLEPALGPSDLIRDAPDVTNINYARRVEFRPQKALIDRINKEATNLQKEVDKLRREADRLQQVTRRQ